MNKMGFGYLRLPKLDANDEKSVNLEACCALADRFLALGGNYFDTAYTYLSGMSEIALRESVVKRHPRSSFRIADKLPPWKLKSHEDCRRMFEEQKERCGVEYFDVYLLHSLNRENYGFSLQYGAFDFLQEVKASGEAHRIGFSYHDGPELLDEILTAHPFVDVVQLQVNYLDWRSPMLRAEELCRVAEKHGKRVIVMEPVKGGSLANPPQEIAAFLKKMDAQASPASWAVRFAQGVDVVETVLSGMNTIEQIEENLRPLLPLSEEETAGLLAAAEELRKTIAIPCTGCNYCAPNCPQNIAIPEYFALYNEYAREPREVWKMQHIYDGLAAVRGRASDCIQCRACEEHCPQRIEIAAFMEKVAAAFSEELESAIDRVRNNPGKRKK